MLYYVNDYDVEGDPGDIKRLEDAIRDCNMRIEAIGRENEALELEKARVEVDY